MKHFIILTTPAVKLKRFAFAVIPAIYKTFKYNFLLLNFIYHIYSRFFSIRIVDKRPRMTLCYALLVTNHGPQCMQGISATVQAVKALSP